MSDTLTCACTKFLCSCSDWSSTGVSPEVNELLMEAQLLQVSLPEIQELYQTLLTKSSSAQQTDRSSPVRASSDKVSGSCWEAHLQHLHIVLLPSDWVKEVALSLSHKSLQTVPHNSMEQTLKPFAAVMA